MPLEKVSITLRDSALTEVDKRGERGEANRSGVISRDLERYYAALACARQSLRDKLNEAEMSAILDNLNGVWMAEPVSIRLIYANVADGIELEGLDKKWKIDGAAMVEKLKALSFAESCALADAAERWWNRVAQGEEMAFADALAETSRREAHGASPDPVRSSDNDPNDRKGQHWAPANPYNK